MYNSLWLFRPGALSTICPKQIVITWGCTSDSPVVTTLRKLHLKKGFPDPWVKKTCLRLHLGLTMEKERSVEVIFGNDLPTASWWCLLLWKVKKIINPPMEKKKKTQSAEMKDNQYLRTCRWAMKAESSAENLIKDSVLVKTLETGSSSWFSCEI